jgi:hypothetical protein
MPQSLALQALADAGFDHQVDSPLFEYARAHALFDILAAAALEDNGFNAREMQKMREH